MSYDAAKQLENLQCLVRALTQESDLTALLTRITQQAVESIEAAGAGDIFLWDESMQHLVPARGTILATGYTPCGCSLGKGLRAQRRSAVKPYSSTIMNMEVKPLKPLKEGV